MVAIFAKLKGSVSLAQVGRCSKTALIDDISFFGRASTVKETAAEV